MIRKLLGLSRLEKQVIFVVADFVALLAAYWLALVIRFETLQPDMVVYGWQLAVSPLVAISVFYKLRLYRVVVRFIGPRVLSVIISGVSVSALLLATTIALTHGTGLSRGVLALYWLLAVSFVGAIRVAAQVWTLHAENQIFSRKRVAIYGAGRAGAQLAVGLRTSTAYWPVLFFDDDPAVQATEVAGLSVYPPKDLKTFLLDRGVEEILLAMPSVTRSRRLEIIDLLEQTHCKVKLIPSMAEIVGGKVSIDDVREIGIEDLLGRETIAPNKNLLAQCIFGKVVLVTGAGGSIGSELCRQIVRLGPARLVLLEVSEFALYSIEQELSGFCSRMGLQVDLVPVLGSVMHQKRNESVMRSLEVQTVYHAAAYKHVPLVEHNPAEGVRNNALGTRRMAEAALAAGVEIFVLVSTDKAVRPTNVMGASKRLAELILQAMARKGEGNTRFCMVRFGNVLGSSGSVVPLFRRQIAVGGPITLTHPEITRYFMTIPEAAQLVIQAGSMGLGGEVYVLDMGLPVKIIELARRMVHLSGLEIRDDEHPDGDIAIDIVGLRPGEKLYEELLIGDNVEGTEHPLIMRAFEHELPWGVLQERLAGLDDACRGFDYEKIYSILGSLIPEYSPAQHGDELLLWQRLSS